MPNLNAALGVAQLERLSNSIRGKRKLAAHDETAQRGLSGAKFLSEPEHCESTYWLSAIAIDDNDVTVRNAILDQTNDLGICTRPLFRPMHMLAPYKNSPRMADLGVSESLYARLINIPSSPQLAVFLGLS